MNDISVRSLVFSYEKFLTFFLIILEQLPEKLSTKLGKRESQKNYNFGRFAPKRLQVERYNNFKVHTIDILAKELV